MNNSTTERYTGFIQRKRTIAITISALAVFLILHVGVSNPAYCLAFQCDAAARERRRPAPDAWMPTELRQYNRFRKTNGEFESFLYIPHSDKILLPVPNISEYAYSIVLSGSKTTSTEIVLRVREKRRGKRTRGGACLYAEVGSGLARGVCSFHDFFNGVYVVWCPRDPAVCTNVTLQLQCVDFGAYSSTIGALHHRLWQRTVCADDEREGARRRPATRDEARLLTSLKRDATEKNDAVSWRRETLRSAWYPSELLALPTDRARDRLCACVKRFDRIVLVGASHMRNKFDFILETCSPGGNVLPKKHSSTSSGNAVYVKCPLVDDFNSVRHLETNVTLTPRSLVILQTGSHDLVYKGLPVTMEKQVERFVDILHDIKLSSNRIGFQLILQTMPPVPDVSLFHTEGGRNNFAAAALMQLLTIRARNLHVEVFDEFHTLLRMQYDNVCGLHYICRSGKPQLLTIGHSGMSVFFLQMSRLCKVT